MADVDRPARTDWPVCADRPDLVVTTPGVATARLREELDSLSDSRLVVERATRCGSVGVDPTVAARLRIAVVPCAVSLHAADRLRRQLRSTRQSVDSVLVCRRPRGSTARPAIRTLADRFECPVSLSRAPVSDEYHLRRDY